MIVFGLGRFGGQVAAAKWFARRGAKLVITDRKPAFRLKQACSELAGLGARWVLGGHEGVVPERADLICLSPAVPRSAPVWEAIRRHRLRWTTEMNLAASALDRRPVCVSGSNGKTTSATLLARALEAGGATPVVLAGNMGRPLLAEVDRGISANAKIVLELSSFQLQDLREGPGLNPALALLTNIAPNHLDRHGDFSSYAREKRWLFETLSDDAVAVCPRHDRLVFKAAMESRARVVSFGLESGFKGAGSFVRDGRLWYRESDRARPIGFGRVERLRLLGRHNLLNVLGVVAACGALGCDPDAVAQAIASFEGLPHRLESLGTLDGVHFVNDSKATTPHAAACAIESWSGRVIALVGGASKGTDMEPLLEAATRHARALIGFGATGPEIVGALRTRKAACRLALEADLEGAFVRARAWAKAGDVVVLTPGCASYDQYASYRERGEHFRTLVREHRRRSAVPER